MATISAVNPSLSSSGFLKVGGYDIGATNITGSSTNFNNSIIVIGSMQINTAPINVSVGPITKTYDGLASAGVRPLVATGIVAGDLASVSGTITYDTPNAGINKTITATNIALNGTDVSNYYVSSLTSTANSGTITAAPLTITASSASKTYNGQAY